MSKLITCPFERMRALDKESATYWWDDLRLVTGERFATCGVVAHQGQWVLIDTEGSKRLWIARNHIVSFSLQEEVHG